MKIFIVIWEDRHCDTSAYPFSTAEKAIAFARKQGHTFDKFNLYKEQNFAGYCFHCTYGEGCGIRVVKHFLDRYEVTQGESQ